MSILSQKSNSWFVSLPVFEADMNFLTFYSTNKIVTVDVRIKNIKKFHTDAISSPLSAMNRFRTPVLIAWYK